MINEISTNLGIYNDDAGNEENINKHIEQGISFRNYFNNYVNAKENDHSLLSKTFFPAMNGGATGTETNGLVSAEPFVAETFVAETYMEGLTNPTGENNNIAKFNTLLNDYKTLYNTYKLELVAKTPTPTVTSAQLIAKYTELNDAAQTLLANQQMVNNTPGTGPDQAAINNKFIEIKTKMDELSKQYNPNNLSEVDQKKLDDTLNGQIETGILKMNSVYYFYIVYFLVAVTIIGMTFNLMVNPNADVMKSVYVVGGILAIYIIAKYIGK